jgi:Flp pilus assembly protein, ATPase CpaF
MEQLNLTGEIKDEDVSSLIDRCILHEAASEYIPLKEKLNLKTEIFNSIRRMDVLSELLEDDEITEIMINGYDRIYIEKNGRLERYGRSFEKF